MSAPNTYTQVNDYAFGRGRPAFNPLVNGVYQGYRDLGNCPAFDVAVAADFFTHTNSQGGIGEVDVNKPTKVTRTASITCEDANIENIALFLAADQFAVIQAATPVTNEIVGPVTQDRYYQIGEDDDNPSGVRGIGSVTVTVANTSAPSRVSSHAYLVGAIYQPATPNAHFYQCTIAGTSASSAPTFTTDGSTFADGTATFIDMGTLVIPVDEANYKIDTTLGLLSVIKGGAIPNGVILEVDYTPVAETRSQLRTSASPQISGKLKFIADNPFGTNKDFFFPDVTLSASGNLGAITADAVVSMQFAIGINKKNSTTAAVYLDGRAIDYIP